MEEKRKGFIDLNTRLIGVEKELTEIKIQLTALVGINKEKDGNVLNLIFENRKDIDSLTVLMSGNSTPEKGLAHRVISLEESRDGNKNHIIAIWVFVSAIIVQIIGSFLS